MVSLSSPLRLLSMPSLIHSLAPKFDPKLSIRFTIVHVGHHQWCLHLQKRLNAENEIQCALRAAYVLVFPTASEEASYIWISAQRIIFFMFIFVSWVACTLAF